MNSDTRPPTPEEQRKAEIFYKQLIADIDEESARRARRKQSGQFGKKKRKSAARLRVKRCRTLKNS